MFVCLFRLFFFFNDTATTEIYTLSLHDALPISGELIGVWALALANKLKMSQIAAMVAPYPTLGEVNKRVAGAYFSPRLFDNPKVKKIVGLVQRWLP